MPSTTKARKESAKRWYWKNREYAIKHRSENVRKKLDKKFEALSGHRRPEKCECCGKPNDSGLALALDHNHKSGDFRGWLCLGCNVAAGFLKDSPERATFLAKYLNKNMPINLPPFGLQ